jgi:hypothetical protein
MSMTTTRTIEQTSMHRFIRFIAPPAPSAVPSPTPSADPIHSYLREMLAEGLVSQRDMEQIIIQYARIAYENGFDKATLLCFVIRKMVEVQIARENDPVNLAALKECRNHLKELLQDLLVDDFDANDFLDLYDVCLLKMQNDQATLKLISARAQTSFQDLRDEVRRVDQKVKAGQVSLEKRVVEFANSTDQKNAQLHQLVDQATKDLEKESQAVLRSEASIVELDERLKVHQVSLEQSTRSLRPLMEKIQKK